MKWLLCTLVSLATVYSVEIPLKFDGVNEEQLDFLSGLLQAAQDRSVTSYINGFGPAEANKIVKSINSDTLRKRIREFIDENVAGETELQSSPGTNGYPNSGRVWGNTNDHYTLNKEQRIFLDELFRASDAGYGREFLQNVGRQAVSAMLDSFPANIRQKVMVFMRQNIY